jgi:hypothetical protein
MTETTTPGRDKIAALKKERPDVAIRVTRTIDPDPHWSGDGPSPEEDGCVCYEHMVTATAIRKGVEYRGTAYLSGSWYGAEDNSDTLAEVSGYLPQMVDEALEELDGKLLTPTLVWWVVTLRNDGQDEDSLYVVQGEDEADAIESATVQFKQDWELNGCRSCGDTLCECGASDYPKVEIYINHVVKCGNAEPEHVRSAPV